MEEKLYRVFYINHGKFFISIIEDGDRVRQAVTKHHEKFNELCIWVTFEKAQRIIKRNRCFPEVWGIVDTEGKQLVVGKFDGILKMK